MSEIVVTWDAILPHLLIPRLLVFAIGIAMFLHFICMANFSNPKSPHILLVLFGAIGGSSVGMVVTSISGNLDHMFSSTLAGSGSVLTLWLWLWFKGLHVREFLDHKYDNLSHTDS